MLVAPVETSNLNLHQIKLTCLAAQACIQVNRTSKCRVTLRVSESDRVSFASVVRYFRCMTSLTDAEASWRRCCSECTRQILRHAANIHVQVEAIATAFQGVCYSLEPESFHALPEFQTCTDKHVVVQLAASYTHSQDAGP